MPMDISELWNEDMKNMDEQLQPIAVDFDGDGIVDQVLFGADFDGDGLVDQLIQEVDLDRDGIADGFMTFTDLAEAGYPGMIGIETAVDYDGDDQVDMIARGVFDYASGDGDIAVYADSDGDHIWEAEDRFFVQDGALFALNESEGLPVEFYEPFDPSTADMDHVIGDPEAYMDNWHIQETSFSCSVASQEFVIEELLGISVEEAELRRIAVENGWLTGVGTCPGDTGRLMEYMGLDVRMSFNNTFEDLCSCLARGAHPVVGVDADELWNGENEELYMPGQDANHSIQVIGVDLQDPENPMVILNDPGVPNGCGAMVPAELFMGAWEDSGCRLVEAYL